MSLSVFHSVSVAPFGGVSVVCSCFYSTPEESIRNVSVYSNFYTTVHVVPKDESGQSSSVSKAASTGIPLDIEQR